MKSLTQYILEELDTKMSTIVLDWYREKHPDSAFLNEFSSSATFQGIYDRLNGKTPLGDGEDAIYGYTNVYKTDVAEEILAELSKLTGITVEKLYELWLNQNGSSEELYKPGEETVPEEV